MTRQMQLDPDQIEFWQNLYNSSRVEVERLKSLLIVAMEKIEVGTSTDMYNAAPKMMEALEQVLKWVRPSGYAPLRYEDTMKLVKEAYRQ